VFLRCLAHACACAARAPASTRARNISRHVPRPLELLELRLPVCRDHARLGVEAPHGEPLFTDYFRESRVSHHQKGSVSHHPEIDHHRNYQQLKKKKLFFLFKVHFAAMATRALRGDGDPGLSGCAPCMLPDTRHVPMVRVAVRPWLLPLVALATASAAGTCAETFSPGRAGSSRPESLEIQKGAAADLVARRQRARAAEHFDEADRLKAQLAELGLEIVDNADGSTELTKAPSAVELAALYAARAAAGKHQQQHRIALRRGVKHANHEPHTRMRARRNKKTNANHRVRKMRAPAFAKWLVATFAVLRDCGFKVEQDNEMSTTHQQQRRNATDVPLLSHQRERGSGGEGVEVLDVAGGSGDLCWELVMGHGVATTVVDPRPMSLSEGKTMQALALARSSSSSIGSGGGGEQL